MNSAIETMLYRSKQDAVLIFFTVVCATQISGFIYILLYFLVLFVANLWVKAWRKRYTPTEADDIHVPRRTYFMLFDPDSIGTTYYLLREHIHKYFTWSFFAVNFIFCPIQKNKDIGDTRRMQIAHETAHCGRGEFLLFVLALFTAMQLFIVPNALLLARLDQENYYYYHITLNLLGLYVLWVGNEIMMRREHIADYIAHLHVGAPYLEYMKSRVPSFPIRVATRERAPVRNFLARHFAWHPSWHERLEFVENAGKAPAKGYWRMCGAAFALSAGSFFVAQFMLSPDNPVFQRVFGSFWSDDIGLVGVFLMFFLLTCIGWLICDASKIMRFREWVVLTFFYCCGAGAAQFSWLFSEATFIRDEDTTPYEILSFPAAYFCWFLYHLALYLNFPMRRSPWTYGLYAGGSLLFIWSGLGTIETAIIDLGYASNPAYWRAFVVNFVFGLIMTGWCLLAACALDLARLILTAVKNRILSRLHPQ